MSITDSRASVIAQVHVCVDERLSRDIPEGSGVTDLSELDCPLSDERIEQFLAGQIPMVNSLEMLCTDLCFDLGCPVTDDREEFDAWIESCDTDPLALIVIRLAREAPDVEYWGRDYASFRSTNNADFMDPPDVANLDDDISYSPYNPYIHGYQVFAYDLTRFGCPPTADIKEIRFWWSHLDANTKSQVLKFVREGQME